MKTRIAFLALCASSLVMILTDVASAHYGATAGSNSSVPITDVGAEPMTRLAQNAPINTSRSNKKAGLKVKFSDLLITGGRQPNPKNAKGSRTVTDKAKSEREREQARLAGNKRAMAAPHAKVATPVKKQLFRISPTQGR
jgi:hypothetical protein